METLSSETLVDGLLRIGEALASDSPLAEQMECICQVVVESLDCDRSSIMVWDGRYYRGKYNYGNPPDIAVTFEGFCAGLDSRLVQAMNEAGPFLVMNDAASLSGIAGIARYARVNASVIAPINCPDGSPLAFISAEFNENIGQFDDLRGRVVLGAARLAQMALLADRARQNRIREIASRRELLNTLTRAEEVERGRLSREIHDDSMQRVMALRLKLGALAERAEDPNTRDSLNELAQKGAATTDSLRDLLQNLHPRNLDSDGLATALNDALARFAIGTGWEFTLINALEIEPPHEVDTVLYRSALQALTTIEVQSNASEVTIKLNTLNRGTQLTLSENSGGLDGTIVDDVLSDSPSDAINVSLRQRIEHTGGTIEVASSDETGSTMNIWIPHQLAGSLDQGDS